MNFEIETIPLFDKQVKRLAKKYPSLKEDLSELIQTLLHEPLLGTPLGNNFFKIRMAVASKGKGKSGGTRVITYLKVTRHTIYLVSIFDNSEKSTITDKELKHILQEFGAI